MNPNPFGIPDFNALGGGNNPLLRSMDMMAQAWKNMASGGTSDLRAGMMPSLSPDDLDRRIRDLRAVESWLQLNLSMLSTTIQGLEIQRSTLAAIKAMAQQGTQAAGGPNPFDAFMAFNPLNAGAAAGSEAGAASAKAQSGKSQEPPKTSAFEPKSESGAQQETPKGTAAGAEQSGEAAAGNAAAQAWWGMLQQQFDAMATATAASMQQVETYRQKTAQASKAGTADKATKPAAASAQTAAKASAPADSKPAAKTAAKKAAPRSSTSSTKKTDRPT